ncbi:MAG: T9SS type A sorting domain-containing protein, partial [Candidatus Kapaibacterium sp.]
DYHSANIGNGIYKSTDNGLTWNVLLSTVSPDPTLLDSVFDGVWNIVLDSSRSDSDIAYAAGFGAIMRSNDGGSHWARVLGDRIHTSVETDVAINSSGILYAYLSGQTEDDGVASTAGVWRSTDGFHWTNITPADWSPNAGRMKIAIAPSNENMLYLGGVDPNIFYGAILQKYTYRSGDGSGSGGIWEDRSANVPAATDSVGFYGLNTYGGYAITLTVHPSDPNIVFFGGTNLYRSWDGFATADMVEWIGGYDPANGAYGEAMNDHPDHHTLIFDPSNPSIAYNANDGGIYKTEDVLGYDDPNFPVIWQDINYNDPASILYDVALDHATPGDTTMLGGFQDQGSWLSYDSDYWYPYYGGDGCYCAIDDGMANLYMSSQEGNIVSYNTATQQWTQLTLGMSQAQFVAPFLLDPTNTDQMYFADNSNLYLNVDLSGGAAWTELSTVMQLANTYITALGMSVVPAHRLYYGTSDGHLYRMDNADGASPTPHEITGSIFPKNAFICCVAVDPQNADSIVVCFSNYHVISIFASNDGGVTWHDASGNLEQNPDGSGDGPSVRWVSIVHQNGETLYLCGTSVGLFSTADLSGPNVTWNPEGVKTIGRAIVENIDARQSDGFVAIATQGSGVYTTHVAASPSVISTHSVKQFAFTLSPNPSTGRVTALFTLPVSGQIKWTVMDVTGRTVLSPSVAEFPAGDSRYDLDCFRLPTGTYFVQLQAGDAIESRRLVIER